MSGICDCGSPWTFLLPFFYSTRRFVLSFVWFYFVLLFFDSLSIAITSIGYEIANLSVFRTFVRFALVWFCLFPHPRGVWEGLRLVFVALPGLFSFLFTKKVYYFEVVLSIAGYMH